jgi:hypothetical protein
MTTLSRGIIIDDPAVGLPIGAELKFRPLTPTYSGFEKTVALRDWESFEGVLLSVHFRIGASHSIHGSGVLIGPGIALCAEHVIRPHMEGILKGEIGTLVTGLTTHGVQIWNLCKVTSVPSTDFCILGLSAASQLPPSNEFRQAFITTRLPKLGEKLMLIGFRAGEQNFEITDNSRVTLSGSVLVCSGPITDRYPQGRDRCMLPWPSLQIACPSWGGMSGGPVFDSAGKLVALLTSSLDSGPSFVSLIWPALTCPFQGGWPIECFRGKSTLLNMDVCAIDNRSALRVVKKNGGTTSIYDIWE